MMDSVLLTKLFLSNSFKMTKMGKAYQHNVAAALEH